MMSKSDFLLSAHNAPTYLAERKLVSLESEIVVRELGGGVSNVVLLVEWRENPQKRWVMKQSLGKLRVKDDWRSDRERIFREAECIQALGPLLESSAAPDLVYIDRQNFLFIMTAAPARSQVWKDLLLSGQVDSAVASEAGRLLATIIAASQLDQTWGQVFEDRTVFDQLRIDPYYRTTAARCPDIAPVIGALIHDSWQIRTALVHGDYSPKNMLVRDRKVFLIDFEVVHWGDPAFDSGFLVNHLMLKAFHQPQFSSLYIEAALKFWETLATTLGGNASHEFEVMTLRHLGALMLARIDGKSPVEYIQDEKTKNRVRRAARRIMLDSPSHLENVFEIVRKEIGVVN